MPRATAVLATLLLLFLLTPVPTPAAKPEIVPPTANPDDSPERFVPSPDALCGTGTLRVRGRDDVSVRDFPLKHTSVDARIDGNSTRVTVTQTFRNPYDEVIEATYVFPLPHRAAVTGFVMRIGDRVIRGEIQPREEARRRYEDAKRSGRVASLLERERANIFTQSVANILPGHEIDVEIVYVEELAHEDGTWEFVFPMVVGPLYIPPDAPSETVPAGFRDEELRRSESAVPDADRITPPILPPSHRSSHDIDLTVDLDAGAPIANLHSPTHVFERTTVTARRTRVRLHPLDRIPNKDFALRWSVRASRPEAAVLQHHDGTSGWVSVVLHPKTAPEESEITPREMVFVLDCSGSMRGEPIAASKNLVRTALRHLGPRDTFRLLRFSDTASGFHPDALPATPDNVARALAYVEDLRGAGGTQMLRGIGAALDPPPDPERLRIVLFLTDGYIGNTDQILAGVRDRIGGARLFSFGIGSSVNRFLLDEMAREGRGAVQFVLPGSDTRAAVEKFWRRVRQPYLTDIELEWRDVTVADVSPQRVPDLFAGQPLVVRARTTEGGRGALVVRGRIAGKPWERTFHLDLPERESGNPAIAALWARSRVGDLMRTMRLERDPATVEAVTQIGLRHSLVTPFTSFVAVDEDPVTDRAPVRVPVPLEMPEGVSWEGVFGADPGAKIRAINTTEEAIRTGAGSVRVGDAFMVLGGRSNDVMSVVEIPPPVQLETFDISAPKVEEIKKEQSATIRVLDTREDPVLHPRVEIRLETARETFSLDEEIELVLVFENVSERPVPVPAAGALKAGDLRLRLTRAGQVRRLGRSGEVATSELAPGRTVRRTVTLRARDLVEGWGPGPVAITLEATRWGARNPEALRLTITARKD